MTTWSGYQSVIQLGAALNFAYASLEAISQQPLGILTEKQNVALLAIRAAVRERKQIANNPVRFQYMQGQFNTISTWSFLVCRSNPYISVSCGFGALALLLLASIHADDTPTSVQVASTVALGYAWFLTSVGSQIILRLWINRLVRKIPEIITVDGNG